MKGVIMIQGVETDDFMTVFVERAVKKIKEQSNWIAQAEEAIPTLTTNQVAVALGCSAPHVTTIVQRHPDKLKPIYENGNKRPVYSTAQVLKLRAKGGYK